MKSIKRFMTFLIMSAMILNCVPIVFAEESANSYGYTFENGMSCNGQTWALASNGTTSVYSLGTQTGVGGKSSEDAALVFKADGTLDTSAKSPVWGIDFRNNAIKESATRIDFDFYTSGVTYDNAAYTNYQISMIPLVFWQDKDGGTNTGTDTGFYATWRPGDVRTFAERRSSGDEYKEENFIKKWHKMSIITEPQSDGTAKITFSIDGTVLDNQVSRTAKYGNAEKNYLGLAGLRFKAELDTKNSAEAKAINAVAAIDNIRIYKGTEAAVNLPSSAVYSTDMANVMTFDKYPAVSELKSAIGNTYNVSVTRKGAAVSDESSLAKDDMIKVTSAADANLSECWYATEKSRGSVYGYNFDDDKLTLEESGGVNSVKSPDGNGFSWSSGQITAEKNISLSAGLGGRDSDNKALAIVTKNFTTAETSGGVNSPCLNWNTSSITLADSLVFDTDVFFEGNSTRAQLMFELTTDKYNASSENNEEKYDISQMTVDFDKSKVKMGTATSTAAKISEEGSGEWHNLAVVFNIKAKTADAYIDGEKFADGIEIKNADAYGGWVLKGNINKITRIKLDSRYDLSGATANGIYAVDNMTLYSGSYSGYKELSSTSSDIRPDNARNIISVSKEASIERINSSLIPPDNYEVVFSDSANVKEGDKITLRHKTDTEIKKEYKVVYLPADFCANYDFESANEIIKQSSGTDEGGNVISYNYLTGGWGFSSTGSDMVAEGQTGLHNTHTVSAVKGFADKDSSDTALVLCTKEYKPDNGTLYKDDPAISFGNTGYTYYDGISYVDFDLYLSGNAKRNDLFLAFNYLNDDGTEKEGQFYPTFYGDGTLRINNEILSSDVTYDKWHNIRIKIDSPAQTISFSVDGKAYTREVSIEKSDIGTLKSLKRMKFVQRFSYYTNSDSSVPAEGDAVIALDNFRIFRRADAPMLILNSSDSDVVVKNSANMIWLYNGKTIDDAKNVLDANKNKIVSDANSITISNDLFSKTYKVYSVDADVISYKPAYNNIVGDDKNIKVTIKAAATADIDRASAIIAEYSGEMLVNINIKTFDNVKKGDIISAERTIPKTSSDTFKGIFVDGFESIRPLVSCQEINYNEPVNIYMIGDSLMCAYASDRYPQYGWGEVLKNSVDKNTAALYNEAVSGESSKSFYYIYFKKNILNKLKRGDYVILSMCHNDEAGNLNPEKTFTYTDEDGVSHTEKKGTSIDEYKEMLGKYADEISAKGATLVYVTGPNTGRKLYAHQDNGSYPEAMKEVAAAKNCECVDLYNIHNDYIKSVNSNSVAESVRRDMFLYQLVDQGVLTETGRSHHANANVKNNDSDLTHFSYRGASMLADWVVTAIKNSESDLKNYLK